MTYEQLEEGLYKGEQSTGAGVENVMPPVYGVPAPGYQQGYPVQQQPLAGWPAYGAPVGAYGTGMPAVGAFPGQPYPYPPPPPIGGGTADELYQISDVGVATIVPGLKVPKHLRIALFISAIILLTGAGTLLGLAGWMITVAGPVSIILWVFGGIELALAIFLLKVAKKSKPVHNGGMTAQNIQEFIDRVTKIGATLPQINVIQSLMSQANPNTPHEFAVWKSHSSTNGHARSFVIGATFNCHNLSRGQKPQLHLFSLVA